jgi:hypothetical protein
VTKGECCPEDLTFLLLWNRDLDRDTNCKNSKKALLKEKESMGTPKEKVMDLVRWY